MTADPSAAAQTPWSAGHFDRRRRPQRILFGQMYEDADIECAAFGGAGRIFCIASAGCTAIRLAREHDVMACDINPEQLAYAQRRSAGGPMETGAADRMMRFLRIAAPLVGWRPGRLRVFLSMRDLAGQITFWRKRLDTHRFRAAFDALLSIAALRAVYAPQFLSVLPPRFGAVLRSRLERGFALHANATNPYARVLLLGENETGADPAPPPSRIQFVCADAAAYLESCPPRSFDGFTLSNILDGARPSYRGRLIHAVRRAARPDATVVLRSFAEPPPDLSKNHAPADRSLVWGVVKVCRAHDVW